MLATSLDLRIALTKKNTGTILLLMSILLKPVQAPAHPTTVVSILEVAVAHATRVVDVPPKATKDTSSSSILLQLDASKITYSA